MEQIPFVSKIPADALPMLYKISQAVGVDPLGSAESEDYFYRLLTDYQGQAADIVAYLQKQIKKDFISLCDTPQWLQSSDWQFHHGKPMCFVGQIEVKINQGSYIHSLMFYVFWDTDTGITKTIIQSE